MSATITQTNRLRQPPPSWPGLGTDLDEAAARRAIRDQIARLESEAGAMEPPVRTAAAAGALSPRLLTLGELEAARDRIEVALRAARRERDELGARQQEFRALRERALLDPAAHAWVRVSNADVGDPGCLDWHVRPRFGVLGAFMRWWRVKISSGCP
jgi:hypothetical protein